MAEAAEYSYVGSELELFIKATNWKNYWASRVRPFVRGTVLDVGAGIGATFDYLNESAEHWTCLEPDAGLCKELQTRLGSHPRPPRVVCGTLEALRPDERFDTIVYIDVLEHIEHDREQARAAAAHLNPGGSLIVLSPALPSLFSPFDSSVGHFRRYTAQSLQAVTPSGLSVKTWFFLDGLGALASLFARVAKRSAPSQAQIATWDKLIVPVSRVTDALTSRLFGRTIVMVWVAD
ncbi:MAG TPA: class I SAM-dependent methyltransferase [Polyangiaceae bacterium]|nr:class I SAM-dependent methyltransferase [Polyangiaceae bacterium]